MKFHPINTATGSASVFVEANYQLCTKECFGGERSIIPVI